MPRVLTHDTVPNHHLRKVSLLSKTLREMRTEVCLLLMLPHNYYWVGGWVRCCNVTGNSSGHVRECFMVITPPSMVSGKRDEVEGWRRWGRYGKGMGDRREVITPS